MPMRDLLATNRHLNIRCHCGDCGHVARLSAIEAVERFGPLATIEQAKRRSRCAKCGARGRHGFISVWPCTLDLAAWHAHEERAKGVVRGAGKSADEELEMTLATLRKLLGGGELGGDGPVQWPVEGPWTGA